MNENWRVHGNPFLDFTAKLTKEWKDHGFTKNQCQEWLGIGLNATDAFYANWLRKQKKTDSEWVLNYGDTEQLRKEYKAWQLKELEKLNPPTNLPKPPFFTTTKLLIIASLTLLTIYLLTN